MAKSINKNGEYYSVYKNFGGMDITLGDGESGKTEFAYTENMYRDYEGDFSNSIESIPGFRLLANFRGRVLSVFMQKCSESDEYIVVHAGSSLFRFNINERDMLGSQNAIANLGNTKSHAFQKGDALFVCDGKKIVKIARDGTTSEINSENGAYVPTVFKNGKPYEQRNLLTRKFKELYVINEYDKHYRESAGIKYEFENSGSNCKIVGLDSSHTGVLYIPKYTKLGNKYYRVTEIADNAFLNHNGISEVYIADGLTRIGKLAFSGCGSMSKAVCPSSIEIIDDGAFMDCLALTDVFIGRNIVKFGMRPFAGDFLLEMLKFESDIVSIQGAEGYSEIGELQKTYTVERPENYYRVPLYSPFESISKTSIGGIETAFEASRSVEDGESDLFFALPGKNLPEGKKVLIEGLYAIGEYNLYDEGVDFVSQSGDDENIIAECRTSAFFDGRIFTAGNPKYPNTVFYSLSGKRTSDTELYFGSLSYFNDGMSAYESVSLIPTSDILAHLKAKDDGSGGIFCHEAKDGGNFLERVYPVLNIHTGINVKGESRALLDEVFFLSDIGASSLKKNSSNTQIITSKSEKINPLLLKGKDLGSAHITSWLGYTVIQIGSEIYLADARGREKNTKDELDWYYISGIGTHRGGSAKCYYSDFAPEGLTVHKNPGKEAAGPIYLYNENVYGGIYYVKEGSFMYAVHLTGESEGGSFYPASAVFSDGRLLFFGTENGDLCLFNTDKRGVPPARIAALADFDQEEYSRSFGNRIHPDFYSFHGKRPKYTVITKPDDAGIPYFKKNLIPNSLSLEFGNLGAGNVVCEIFGDKDYRAEASNLSCCMLDFSELDFSSFSFDVNDRCAITVLGGPKSFREISISVSSSEFLSPISISEISYRYKIKGRLTRK